MDIKRFFRNYLLKGFGLLIAFFLANLIIAILMVVILRFARTDGPYEKTFSLTQIEESLTGQGVSREALEENLKANGAFILHLDENGNVIDKVNLPKELDHHYTLADGVSFSRWYLGDYPTFTRILDDGSVLVKGLPKGSSVKYSVSISPVDLVLWELAFVPILLLFNLILFLIIDYFKTRSLTKNLEPILTGVEDLAHGKKVDLPLKGPLKEINAELNKASRILLRKEEDRVDWISGISHDVRTPLTAIITANNLIELGNGNSKDLTKRIEYNALKIKRLVEGLNLESKLNYGLIPINPVTILAAQAFSDPIVDFMNENGTVNHSVNVALSQECWSSYITVDPDLLNRLVGNLLLNSIVHNPEGVDINVEAKKDRENLALIISDNGHGLNQSLLEEVNAMESPLNFRKHGHGLNLVKRIAEALEAEIYFENTDPQGLSVKIVFQTNGVDSESAVKSPPNG